MSENQTLEQLLEKETAGLPPGDQRLCRALLRAIRHVQLAPEPPITHLPDKLINAVLSWFKKHEFDVQRSELPSLVDYIAGLPSAALPDLFAGMGFNLPRSGRLVKKISIDRANAEEATAFSVIANLTHMEEKTIKLKVSKGRRKRQGLA